MRLILAIILLAACSLSGCNGADNTANSNSNSNANSNANSGQSFRPVQALKPEAPPDPKFKPCNPYFPLVPGSVAKYVINYSSGITGDLTIVVDAADENGRKVFTQRSQLIDRSGGMEITQTTVRTFVCDRGVVQILSEKTESNIAGQESSSEFEYRENSVMMVDAESAARKGTTWTHAFRSTFHRPGQPPSRSDEPTILAFEVQGPDEVTAAIGTFKAVKIVRKIKDNLIVDFYVPGLGLVKRQAQEGTSWELKEYSGLKTMD